MLRRFALILGLALTVATAPRLDAQSGPGPAQGVAGRQAVTLASGRSYLIDLPAHPARAPMILALHGGGGNPAQFARSSGLSGPANRAGYAVIYPAGTGRRFLTWNGGYCCGVAARGQVDDVAFLEEVRRDAARRFGLNAARAYATGMSNGALMAEAYGALRPDALRAVAGVAGTLDLTRFPPRAAVPLLHIHGTADDHVPYDGGRGPEGLTQTPFTAVADVIAAYYTLTPGLLRSERTIDTASDGMRVRETTWTKAGRPMIRLITIEGGGHVWPGGRRAARQAGATQDINATDEILRFFAQVP